MIWLKWLKEKLFKSKPTTTQPIRRYVDTSSIRIRILRLGWDLKEIPVKRLDQKTKLRLVNHWKITAFKGTKSIESVGTTIDDAMHNIGRSLGVIPLDSPKKT